MSITQIRSKRKAFYEGASRLFFRSRNLIMSHAPEQSTSHRAALDAALIVFGLDNSGRPHAARFDVHEAALAQRAAETLRMQTLAVTTEELRAEAQGALQGQNDG
ncbi:hypothetical protein [Methylobacterium sp. WSM2598]|uniref:hypothetical protein n=1 Tax=Methylobacterium sp. WSM2598 TaxID=398261 RepID=UPI0012F64222|nr:hypothetical protein [Methylobacterium sp. WSM2598]